MAGFRLEVPRAALVITDPQSVERNHTVENIERLLQAAKRASMAVAISPLMDRVGLPIALDAPEQHGADFLPAFKPYFVDGRTLVASAHKAYGPERDDLAKRLRGAGVSQVVLAGCARCSRAASRSRWSRMRRRRRRWTRATATRRRSSTSATSPTRSGAPTRR